MVNPPLEHKSEVPGASLSPARPALVPASETERPQARAAIKGMPSMKAAPPQIRRAACSRDGGRVVTAGGRRVGKGELRVWNGATGEPVTPPLEHQEAVIDVAFSPDGSRVVSASFDTTACV